MVKSRLSAVRSGASLFCLLMVFAWAVSASAQDFTLTAINQGSTALQPGGSPLLATITADGANNVTGSNVALTCSVTPVQTSGTPACAISPTTVTTPASATLTVTAPSGAPSGLYNVSITGTDASGSQSVSLPLSILAVQASYTLNVTTSLGPSSVPPGSGATGVITLTPINGYTGSVTLSCSNISPAASPPPVCAFTPNPVQVISTAVKSTITVSTFNPNSTGSIRSKSRFLWVSSLMLPALGFVGLGFLTSPCRRKKRLMFLLLSILGTSLISLPACTATQSTTSNNLNGTTPKNSYTITITGSDANATAPSNGTQTVTLTVN